MTETKIPLSGKRVLLYFILFFGLVAAMDTIFITLATKTHTGVVADQAYERGLALNKWEDAAKQELDLTSKAEITFQKIRFHIEDNNKTIIEDADVKVHGMLTNNDKTDFKLPLKYIGGGWYEIDMIWPQRGKWDLFFTVKTPDGSFYKKESYRYLPK